VDAEIQRAWLEACQRLLAHLASEGNDFLYSSVTGDESWLHHCGLEMKSHSLEYGHPTSPRRKEFKTQPFAGKCMLTIFCD
jgi:hypothetical protein